MVGLASLPYHPLFAFVSQKAQTRSRKRTIQSAIRVPSSPSKLTKRKNYLRPKILKTLTKPYPVTPPTPDDPVAPIEHVEGEQSFDFDSEPKSDELGSGVVERLEELGDVNESDLGQVEVVHQVSEGQNVVGFSWFSGRMVFRIVASFVGLFVLQTVVAVWIMGRGETEEKDRNLRIEGSGIRKVDVGMNGNVVGGSLGYVSVDELEMEGKIAEIRKMAREARALEKQNLENSEADMSDVSDDDEEDGVEMEASRLRSGIVKEVDGRLTKLRKNSPAPLLNVNLLNKARDDVKEMKNEGVKDEEENDMLMFEMKRRFRGHSTAPSEKPKGFQSIKGSRDIREKPRNMDNEKATETYENQSGSNGISSDENREVNGLDTSFPDKKTSDSHIDEKKPGSQSSSPQRALKKGFGNNGGTRKLNKRNNGSASTKASGSNNAMEKLNNRINNNAKPERGVVQDPSHGNPVDHEANLKYSSTTATKNSHMKMSDLNAASTPEMHTLSEPLRSDEFGSTQSMRKNKDKQQIRDSNPWWLNLPYALVVLMQKGHDEGLEGFYTLRIESDADSRSYTPYIVAFEDRNDARNFSYLLESSFEDLPDASIDVVPLPTKELKQVSESLRNKVIVVKKGELQLYAGQPLAEVETVLRSLVK